MTRKHYFWAVVVLIAVFAMLTACKSNDDPQPTDGDTEQDSSTEDVWCDPPNQLCWQNPSAPNPLTWEAAKTYCDNLVWAQHEDWRLPTIDELRSIVKGCAGTQKGGSCGVLESCAKAVAPCFAEACNGCALGGGPDSGCFRSQALEGPCQSHWSATAVDGAATNAWLLDFTLAKVQSEAKSGSVGLRCVRPYTSPGESEEEHEAEREEDGDQNEDGDSGNEQDLDADGDKDDAQDGDSEGSVSCTPNTYRCSGDWVQICSGSGQSWGNHTNCAAESKTCQNGACVGGGGKCGCACTGHDCTPSPSGTNFTYQGCANWPDADQCSGFLSVYCEEECAGTSGTACFDNCSTEFGGKQFDSGNAFSMGDCTITIHCP